MAKTGDINLAVDTRQTIDREPLPPHPDLVVVHPDPLTNRPVRQSISREQHDPGPLGSPGLNGVRPQPLLQLGPDLICDLKGK